MSNGKDHNRATIAISIPTGLMTYFYSGDITLGFLGFIGCLYGLIQNPDLDIKLVTDAEKILIKIPIIGKAWYLIWLPYGTHLPHRSYWSHLPISSTIIRFIYLGIMTFPIYFPIFWFYEISWNQILETINQNFEEIMFFAIGTGFADLGHFILDLKWVKLRSGRIKFL